MNISRWQFEHARRFPEEIGVVFGAHEWTNAQLHQSSCRFASALLAMGVEPGDRVAIALGNSPELFIACWGVAIAGGALVALGDRFSEEMQAKTEHCEPRVLVCVPHLVNKIRTSAAVIRIVVGGADLEGARDFDALVAHAQPAREFVEVSEKTLAQLCYTSGSTGKPKAVPYTYGALDRFLEGFAATLPDRETSQTVLVPVPPTAFVCRMVHLRVLANYRYIVLSRFEPEPVLAAVQQHRVEQISLVPTMAEQLIACNEGGRFDCSSLRSIHIAGSHVPAALVSRLKTLASKDGRCESPLCVTVDYGMTEAGGGIASTTDGGDGVVGRLTAGVVARIVGADGTEARPGDVGEITVSTPYVPEGYWRDPQQSTHVFRDGFVHTGDVGYFREDGRLCIVGRAKDMIIQAGANVYPAELIKVIYAMDGVRECAVVGCPNEVLGEEVVACIVRGQDSDLTEARVRAQCRRSLEPNKQPVRVLFLDALPKREGGKVDVEALRREVTTRERQTRLSAELPPGAGVSQAQDIVERELRAILLQDLPSSQQTPRLDPYAPFGELGLTSQGAVRLAHALRERLGLYVPAFLAYSCPTIQACAQWLVAARAVQPPPLTANGTPCLSPYAKEPIAIVGLGVRLPGGVSSPAEFWDLLWSGRDAVQEVPAERRRGTRGGSWRAACLAEMGDFDAAFFRLNMNAAEIDPRHRQLLEVCWEALENAGIDPARLHGNRTGIFLGLSGELYPSPNPLGAAIGMAAAHLCHFFNVGGPVVTVDTTCSSSLVALDTALQSLNRLECDVAIVGSSNILSEPRPGDLHRVMSRDGCTRAFDAAANGFGQGEGSVVLVLRRLADARRAGDRVYACALGSAINHVGRGSSLAAPNPQSQAGVVTLALKAAGVAPESVQYVEAHGTATLLGDPIEVDGLVRSLGTDRPRPVAIGSVKSNVGHLIAAAGLAGVAKVALSISERQLPATLHCTNPNPRIRWEEIPVRVQSSRGDWPAPHQPLIAGVSSFGMSGTNAHVVLAECPTDGAVEGGPSCDRSAQEQCWLLPVSAGTEGALREGIQRWIRALERDEHGASCRDIAYTASCRRAHLPVRIAVTGSSRQEWLDALREHVAGAGSRHVVREPQKLALLFSGEVAQCPGVGRRLCAQEPVFRDSLASCASLLDRLSGSDLSSDLVRGGASELALAGRSLPALFAVQVALYELLKSWGLRAAAAVGVGAGEAAASYAAGLLTLEEAAHRVAEWTRGSAPPNLACVRDSVLQLVRDGCTAFLEVAAHPVLLLEIRAALEQHGCGENALVMGSLHRDSRDVQPLLESLGRLHCFGVEIDWARRYDVRGRHVDLPGYPWEHVRYWHGGAAAQEAPTVTRRVLEHSWRAT